MTSSYDPRRKENEWEQRIGPPRWDGNTANVDVWTERVQLFILSTKKNDRVLLGPQLIRSMEPGSRQYLAAMEISADDQVKEDGAMLIAKHLKSKLAETAMADAAQALRDFLAGKDLRRRNGEGAKSFIQRFEHTLDLMGRKLHAACSDIPAQGFLHNFILGMLFLDFSGLGTTERATVLATSSTRGNSHLYPDLKASLVAQWSDAALAERDRR